MEMKRQPRDLRKIDSRVPNLVPTILIRKEAILVSSTVSSVPPRRQHLFQVNILHIRALVKADTVVLFDTYGSADSRLHSVFLYHLEVSRKTEVPRHTNLITSPNSTTWRQKMLEHHTNLGRPHCPIFGGSKNESTFHRAIESILLSVLSALEAEMVFIRNLVGGLLAELEDDIDHDRFKRLLHYSRRLASFKNRASLVCAA